ncbi:hypothetical protein DFH09DRAFT_1169861 [Mycena vulgaris]|nr:hypothetical protein DFH09DRAFT_1169861 [Mycena vulgaris]
MASTQQGEAITECVSVPRLQTISRALRACLVSHCALPVQLRHLTGALAFCPALIDIESPIRGQFIQSFSFFSPMSTSRLLLDSINLMPRLEHLTTHNRELLRTCTVPSLVSCRIGFKSGIAEADVLASFLARHPDVTRARVDVHAHFRSTPSLPIALPYLERFDGPAYFVPLMLPVVRRLRETRLSWGRYLNPPTADIERILAALPSLTSPDIPFFSSYEYPPYSVPIVTAASIHMPHVKTLRLQTLSFELHDIRHITTCLPRFTALAYLALDPPRNPLIMHASYTDQAAVAAWANVCPILEACCLSTSTRLCMEEGGGAWEEYTMQEFEMQAGISDEIGRYVSVREAK